MSELQKFLFEGLPVRGAVVQLTDVWQEILARHQQSHAGPTVQTAHGGTTAFLPAVCELVGEMAAAAALLHSTIKFNGALVLQIMGDGPLKLAVAEVQSDMGLRATAKISGDVPVLGGLDALSNVSGQGRCAITLDPQDKLPGQQPYQGIVPLADASGKPFIHLSQVIEAYMQQSEQLPTRVILAANEQCAAGLLVQRLPVEGENNLGVAERDAMDEHFNRIAMLAASLKREELLTLDVNEVLHRLFWQEELRLFDKQQPYFHCTCSYERVAQMLRGLGRDEVESILSEQGQVEVDCDFCGARYQFDPIDAQRLLASDDPLPPASEQLQ